MILILSEEMDLSTNEVIDWFKFYKQDFIRINNEDLIEVEEINISNGKLISLIISIVNRQQKIDLCQITSYWYRKGDFQFDFKLPTTIHYDLNEEIKEFLMAERFKIIDFIHLFLQEINGIGCIYEDARNKLAHLLLASKFGLKIPNTIISSKKNNIDRFKQENNKIITKAICDGLSFFNNDIKVFGYTTVIKNLEYMPEKIFPTLCQNMLEKKCDLRIFYLNQNFYSTAVLSQNDPQTQIDFRQYNLEKSNRILPFKLPKKITIKLLNFMNHINYKSGSIDMVYTKNKEFVFLEINAVGQFGQVSYPCNYNIEKKIAEYLINVSKV